MRLLQILRTTDPSYGGPLEWARALAGALGEMGHECDLATLEDSGATSLGGYGYAPRWEAWLAERVRAYDAVIVHGIWNYQSVGSWRVLQRAGVPWFLYTHGMLDPWFEKSRLKHLKKMLYWKLLEHRTLRDATAVLFTTEEERLLARQSFRPFACRERVVSLGIGRPPVVSGPGPCEKKLIVFLGRVHPKKGCDNLVRAFAELAGDNPDLRLVIAGPDNEGFTAELREMAGRLGVGGSVVLCGPVYEDRKWELLRAADLFILPSHSENFGVTVVEALACGRIVAITNKVNIWREIEQDQAGLVTSDDVAGNRRVIEKWLAMDEQAIARMRERAIYCFERRYEVRNAVANLLLVFEESGIDIRPCPLE